LDHLIPTFKNLIFRVVVYTTFLLNTLKEKIMEDFRLKYLTYISFDQKEELKELKKSYPEKFIAEVIKKHESIITSATNDYDEFVYVIDLFVKYGGDLYSITRLFEDLYSDPINVANSNKYLIYIIKKGYPIDKMLPWSKVYPLFYAAYYNDLKLFNLLVENGAKFSKRLPTEDPSILLAMAERKEWQIPLAKAFIVDYTDNLESIITAKNIMDLCKGWQEF
jgi:hypothetical protein